jgi:hypothetical protein
VEIFGQSYLHTHAVRTAHNPRALSLGCHKDVALRYRPNVWGLIERSSTPSLFFLQGLAVGGLNFYWGCILPFNQLLSLKLPVHVVAKYSNMPGVLFSASRHHKDNKQGQAKT